MTLQEQTFRSTEPPRVLPEKERRTTLVQHARPLEGLELTMAQLGVTDLIVGHLRGALSPQVLHQAAYRVQCRHPGLRARIRLAMGHTARPTFEFCEPDIERLFVEEVRSGDGLPRPGAPLWERVTERELNLRFDVARGYMFRVIWVPDQAEGGHLLIAAQHALVDGISLMRLLHEVASEAANLVDAPGAHDAKAVEALPPTPSVLTQLPVRMYERIGVALLRRALIRAQRTYHTYSPFPIEAQLPAGGAVLTNARFAAGETSAFQQVRAACKREGVTIGGAFAAAAQFASLRLIRERTREFASTRGRVSFPMTMDFSMRRAILNVSRTAERIGLYTGACDVGVSVPPTVTFWELARRLKARSERQFERRAPLLFHQVLDALWNVDQTMADFKIDYVESGGIAESVNVSNVGTYPFPTRVGSLTLDEVFGANSAMRGGPMFIVWLRSVNDRFFYTATNALPAATRETGDRLFLHLVQLMEGCHRPDITGLTLHDYVHA